jgi:hypothetical protein
MDGYLYISTPSGYDWHSKHNGTDSIQEYKNYQVPLTSVAVTICPRPNGWKISGPISPLFQFPPTPTPGAFTDYLDALAPWESTLFHSLEMNIYPIEMVSLLISNSFLSTSDGSVKFSHHASFGWSLSLPNGRRLATCSRPAYGAKPTSYQAEGYGMLSLLCFLLCLFQYCNTMQAVDGIIACDNLSLINRVLNYQSPFPTTALLDEEWTPFDSSPTTTSNRSSSATLAPNWDVLNEIRHSLHELPFCPTFQHSKGHQDCDTHYDYLPLLAHVLLFPHAGAQLQIVDGTITYNYKSFIQNAAHGPPLLNYIQQRNQWTPAIMQFIDWDAHGMAIHGQFHQRVHLTKLIHDILPTNDNVSQWKTLRLENVPPAHTPEKTETMFFAAPTLLKWNGDESFLSISEQHVTNCILALTFK